VRSLSQEIVHDVTELVKDRLDVAMVLMTEKRRKSSAWRTQIGDDRGHRFLEVIADLPAADDRESRGVIVLERAREEVGIEVRESPTGLRVLHLILLHVLSPDLGTRDFLDLHAEELRINIEHPLHYQIHREVFADLLVVEGVIALPELILKIG